MMKFCSPRLVTGVCVALLLAGCRKQPTQEQPVEQEASWQIISESDMTSPLVAQRDRAEKAVQALSSSLKERLMEVAGEDGPVAAITVCSQEAPQIAARVSQEHDLTIGRTSFRLRNQNNQPPQWATQLVADRVEQPTFLVREGQLAALLPIRLQAECLLCHGEKGSLLPTVSEALTSHYPEDQAVGFQSGDLRGWFWVEVPGAKDGEVSRADELGQEFFTCRSMPHRDQPAEHSGVQEAADAPALIFDTDMGSDCDDAGALAVAHALADAGEIRLLGAIFSSGKNRFGAGVCDAINTYFGRGDLPLGQYAGTDVGDPGNRYSRQIATAVHTYHHDIVDNAPDLVAVYKSILTEQQDSSVTIVTVGHPHGLVHLLRDPGGAELVEAKVDRWVAMGGPWNFGQCGIDAYMEELLDKWSKPLYVSLAGVQIKTGHRKLPDTERGSPVREAYRLWDEEVLRSGRPSWDQLAVLYVARPELFTVQKHGRHIRQAPKQVVWNTEQNHPLHFLVEPRLPDDELATIIEDLMTRTPQLDTAGVTKELAE